MKKICCLILGASLVFYDPGLFASASKPFSDKYPILSEKEIARRSRRASELKLTRPSIFMMIHGEFIYDRKLEIRSEKNSEIVPINKFKVYKTLAHAGLTFLERINIVFGAGVASLDSKIQDRGELEMQSDMSFAWSLGSNVEIYKHKNTTIWGFLNYFGTDPRIRKATSNGTPFDDSIYKNKFEFSYNEWDGGVGLSHRFNSFIPFFYAKYAGVRSKVTPGDFTGASNLEEQRFRVREPFSVALGFKMIEFFRHVNLTAEGRLGGENAASVSLESNF